MQEAYQHIRDTARARKVTLRTGAFILACERILKAREMRGLYP
jgi:glutamate dehydrogenase (NAD(P)+)